VVKHTMDRIQSIGSDLSLHKDPFVLLRILILGRFAPHKCPVLRLLLSDVQLTVTLPTAFDTETGLAPVTAGS
jgi:hypothetical protein